LDLIGIMACVAIALKAEPVEIPRIVYVDDLGGARGRYECNRAEPTIFIADNTRATHAHEFAHVIQVQGWGVVCHKAATTVWELGASYAERKCG